MKRRAQPRVQADVNVCAPSCEYSARYTQYRVFVMSTRLRGPFYLPSSFAKSARRWVSGVARELGTRFAFAVTARTRHDAPMLRWIALQMRLSSLTSSHATGAEVMHSSFSSRRGRARRLPLTAELWALAWPAILRNVLNCACDRLTLALVGHYDPSTVHYDGAGLGKMYSNITGLSVGLGINLGLATLCSQATAPVAPQRRTPCPRRCTVWLVVAFAYSAVAVLFAER